MGVVASKLPAFVQHVLDDTCGRNGLARGARVGAHEPRGPEQRAAEVTGDDDDRVGESLPFDYLQDRSSRRARRLAVVVHADDPPRIARDVGVAVMGRRREFVPYGVDERQRRRLIGYGRDVADETALFYFYLNPRPLAHGCVTFVT